MPVDNVSIPVVLCLALRMFFKVHVKMQSFYQHFLTSDMHRLSKVIHKVVRITYYETFKIKSNIDDI